MSDVVIRAECLSKLYRLGEIGGTTLREDMQRWWQRARGREEARDPRDHWALRDVSFEVKRGEVLGVIGRNGAGKSTLLKILSRTTAPTKGRALVKGRIGSLLEVGTGFHPELSGRENIFLNGAILGMKNRDIWRRLDEIVDFSGIHRHLNTPVKRYSSGMYIRLAFAVAAHLEPDILIVDEVLAVGDAAFQKKCIGKMNEVSRNGRTVLLVSHNLGVISSLCTRALLLDEGKVLKQGSVDSVAQTYLSDDGALGPDGDSGPTASHQNRVPGMKSCIRRIRLLANGGSATADFQQAQEIKIELQYDGENILDSLAGCGFNIKSASGVRVGGFNTYMASAPPHRIPAKGSALFTLENTLTPGTYYLTCSIGSQQGFLIDQIEDVLQFTVRPMDVYGTGYILTPEDGVTALNCAVKISAENS